jgi:hypothetical protein
MTGTPEATHAVIKHNLSSLLPVRVVIRHTVAGTIEGLIENSFSMGWSTDRVNIFWSGRAYSILGEHNIDGIENASHNADSTTDLVIDPLAEDSPIEIDWAAWRASTTKFDKRNAPFTMKAPVSETMDPQRAI